MVIESYDELKEMLLEQRANLISQFERLAESTKQSTSLGYSTHQADDSSRAFDQARDLALQQQTRRTLEMVEEALERFEKGTYGICVDCHTLIDKARLEAIPYTPLCLRCAERREFFRR